jgi:serine protease Do
MRFWLVVLGACGDRPEVSAEPPPPAPSPAAALPPPADPPGRSPITLGGVPAATLPDVAERVTRSVVAITVQKPVSPPNGAPPSFFDVPQHRQQDGVGSGVVARADGVVITNHHVIDGATAVEVTLSDGRRTSASVVGGDPRTDIAVIRLDDVPDDLVPIDFGRSETLRVGEVVLAVGNPFGVGQTVTMGIVSALGRTGLGLTDYEDFIQTDAAINPGNSGGALVDLHGRLIGINAAIRSESGGSEGIGFAIPIDRARRIAESLLATGRVERGFLGVSMQPADPAVAASLGAPAAGVVVTDVVADSPASAAGFRPGDVIVELDGDPVRDLQRFRYEVASLGPGHPFAATVLRDGERLALSGTLGALPAAAPAPEAPGAVGGAVLAPLSPEVRQRFGVPETVVGGVVVTSADAGPLAEAGLRPGDVVLDAERHRIDDPAALAALWARAAGGHLLLRVWRAGDVRFVAVAVP